MDELKRAYVSASDIAKIFKKTRQAVIQKIKLNKIPYEKMGNVIVLKRENLHLLKY